jgi:tetratricopeptide (TPR) repeat protein
VSEQRRRLEKALRGCAEGWTPRTTDPWPAIRERVDGSATSATRTSRTVGQDADQTRATEPEPWATFNLGSNFDRQGEYDLAVEAYQQVIALGHPEAATRAAFNLGILFEERGEYELAEEAYQQAIDSEHSEWAPKAAFNLAMLFEERGEYELAEEAYQQAIDSEHSDAASKARLNLGVLLEQVGEYDLAEEAYQQAINSGHPEVAPKGIGNLRGLPMRSSARAPTQPPGRSANFSAKGNPAP